MDVLHLVFYLFKLEPDSQWLPLLLSLWIIRRMCITMHMDAMPMQHALV